MGSTFKKKLVSVIIPTYNHVNFVDETLASITSQSYSDLEIIVCDDCSNDGTQKKIEDWAKKDNRIISIISDKNEGLSINLNKGLDLAKGEFLSLIGGDDKMGLCKIEKQVDFLNNNLDFDVVLHWVEVFDSTSGKILRTLNSNIIESPMDWVLPKVSFGISKKNNDSTFPPTAYLARSTYALHSRYDYRLKFKNEVLFAIDNYVNKPEAKWYCIPEVLGYYRLHEKNMHRSKEMAEALLEETYINFALASARYPFLIKKLRRILQYFLYQDLYHLSIQSKNKDNSKVKLAKARFKTECDLFRYWIAITFFKRKAILSKVQKLNIKELKYKISLIRKAMRNADNNLKIIDGNHSLHIDPEFQVIDSTLEGFNYLFGRGRLEKSSLGLFTYIQYGANIGSAKVGRFCSIGPNVLIAHGEHPTDFLSTHPLFYESSYIKDIPSLVTQAQFNSHKEVNIGSDVWVGANCYIRDGVTIGDGAIIGTGSIVTKDIPPYSVAVGVPAKIIKMRFDEATVQELMELKWWNWDIAKIIDNREFFQGKLNRDDLIRMSK